MIPGATISGFTYFKVADGKPDPAKGGATIPEDATLHAQPSNQDGGAALTFAFAIRQALK